MTDLTSWEVIWETWNVWQCEALMCVIDLFIQCIRCLLNGSTDLLLSLLTLTVVGLCFWDILPIAGYPDQFVYEIAIWHPLDYIIYLNLHPCLEISYHGSIPFSGRLALITTIGTSGIMLLVVCIHLRPTTSRYDWAALSK